MYLFFEIKPCPFCRALNMMARSSGEEAAAGAGGSSPGGLNLGEMM